jgi:hypothetical protein
VANKLADWIPKLIPVVEMFGDALAGVADVAMVGANALDEWAAGLRDLGVTIDGNTSKMASFRDVTLAWLEGATKGLAFLKATRSPLDAAFIGQDFANIHAFFARARGRDRHGTAQILSNSPGEDPMLWLKAKVDELNTELQKHAATIGMSSDETKIWTLAQLGASDALLEESRRLALVNKGLDLKFKGRPELEKMRKEFEDITKAAQAANLTDEQFGGALLDVMKGHDMGAHRLAGAAEAGTSEAQSIINRAIAGQSHQDPVALLKQILDQLRRQGEVQARDARAIADAVRAGKVNFAPAGV